MTIDKTVRIIIVTYDRFEEICKTINALIDLIDYNPDNLIWHIADDGTPGDYLERIAREFRGLYIEATKTYRKGWGANVNKALLSSKEDEDYVFICEDDYVANKKIRLSMGVAVLENVPNLGAIRYDGLAGHLGLRLNLQEIVTPEMGKVDYLIIDPVTSKHFNVYSNRPHLRHRRFTNAHGLYKEGLKLGQTEVEFAHRIRDNGKPYIGILDGGIVRRFDHIGKSRQHTNEDINNG